MRRILLTGCALVAGASAAIVAAPAMPATAKGSCMQPGEVSKPVPWAQKLLMPERVWPLATGAGVKIGILDSGVDAKHPQLAGHVEAGQDFLYNKGAAGNTDCIGHGTAVASLMVAQQASGTGFRGISPDATVIPVVVSEKDGEDEKSQGSTVSPAEFAAALRWVADHGAKVVNLSLAFKIDHPEVRAAVRDVLAADVVIIAATGNFGADGNPTTYPAAYDGVIGVGAIDQNGMLLPESGRGPYVDLVAPGGAVIAAAPGSGHGAWSGTSFAAPFVAATAALVRQYYPKLTAAQVAKRLTATASPAPGGPGSTKYGYGVVDPYRAVTDQMMSPAARVRATPVVQDVDEAAAARDRASRRNMRTALIVGGIALLVTLLLLGAMLVRRQGRMQGWRPARSGQPVVVDDDPTGAPAKLFDDFP